MIAFFIPNVLFFNHKNIRRDFMEKIIYTTTAVNVDGLNGKSFIEGNGDKNWAVDISSPLSEKEGTNPEQLFALAYATCLNASIGIVEKGLNLEHQCRVEVKVDLTKDPVGEGYLFLPSVRVLMPTREEKLAKEILEGAERVCPIQKLLQGVNVPPVELVTVNG